MSPAIRTLEEAYPAYLDAVRAGDRRQAFDIVRRARDGGLALRSIYLEVFQPTLREIGRLWEQNELTVAEEHLATAITQAAMLRLYTQEESPGGGPTLVAACAETERHEVGLRMLCDIMDLEGWTTYFLGAAVPPESLIELVRDRNADVLALSASIAPHLSQLRSTITAVRTALGRERPLILVGGRPFLEQPELAFALGADETAADAVEAATLLRERLG